MTALEITLFGSGSTLGPPCVTNLDNTHTIALVSSGDVTLGSTTIPGAASSVVVAQVEDDGTVAWSRRTMGSGELLGLHSNPDRTVVLANAVDGPPGFDGPQNESGATDMFVAVLAY